MPILKVALPSGDTLVELHLPEGCVIKLVDSPVVPLRISELPRYIGPGKLDSPVRS